MSERAHMLGEMVVEHISDCKMYLLLVFLCNLHWISIEIIDKAIIFV